MPVLASDDLLSAREDAKELVGRILGRDPEAPGVAVAAMVRGPEPASEPAPALSWAAADLLATLHPGMALRSILGPELAMTPGKLERTLRMRNGGRILLALEMVFKVAEETRGMGLSGPLEGLRKRSLAKALEKLGWTDDRAQWPYDPSLVVIRVMRARLVKQWLPQVEAALVISGEAEGVLPTADGGITPFLPYDVYPHRLLAELGQKPRTRFPDGTTHSQRLAALKSLCQAAATQARRDRKDALEFGLGPHWAPLLRRRTVDWVNRRSQEGVGQPRRQWFVGPLMQRNAKAFLRRDLKIPDLQKFWPVKTPFRKLGIHRELLAGGLRERLALRSRLLILRTLVEVLLDLRERHLIADATLMVKGMEFVALGRQNQKGSLDPQPGVFVPEWGEKGWFEPPEVQEDWALFARRQPMVREFMDPKGRPAPCILVREARPGFWQAVTLGPNRGLLHFVVALPEDDAAQVKVVSVA